MRGALRTWLKTWRGRGLALGLIALLAQVIVPAGYMVAQGPRGPAIAICTGHGPLLASADLHHRGKAPPNRAAARCAFAGHGALAPPALAVELVQTEIRYAPAKVIGFRDLAPGRGLAAPPPPSLGPPTVI